MRVLIVSESREERARAGSMLRGRDGITVVEADSARAAKAAVVAEAPDVMVIDGNLSPQGGYSFLYEVGQDATQRGTTAPPSIVLTARNEDGWLAGWAHASTTLSLPADPFAVAQAVHALAPTVA